MKTYQTSTSIQSHHLYSYLSENLPVQFNDKIKGKTPLYVTEVDNAIQIGLPAPYEEYLYKIELNGRDINISKSEHYTDDVNSLALEDILTDEIISFIGKENITQIVPSTN